MTESYGKLPLTFEANRGQTDARVKFFLRGGRYTMYLTSSEAVFALRRPPAGIEAPRDSFAQSISWLGIGSSGPSLGVAYPRAEIEKNRAEIEAIGMKLLGANPQAEIAGASALPGRVSYFIGNDPSKWIRSVPTYARVEYRGIYPGVDLLYYGNEQQLENDLLVAPGADPAQIRLRFEGAQRLGLSPEGDLSLKTSAGELRLLKPHVYQDIAGARRDITAAYVLSAEQTVSISLGDYDRAAPLVIDPVLVYSTYLGGTGDDQAFGIAVDAAGNVYLAGATSSSDFPTTPGVFQTTLGGTPYDAFISKLNATGTALVYSAYLGGSLNDKAFAVAVDAAGNAYVTGQTDSPNFPTTPGAFQTVAGTGIAANKAFVASLNPTGTALLYSTYLGGNSLDEGFGIATDGAGNAYVVGLTQSTNFPTTSGAFQSSYGGGGSDAFVTVLNSTGTGLVYSTYLGGNGNDYANAIALDAAGNAYVTGEDGSSNFPTTPGAFQTAFRGKYSNAFITKLNPTGTALDYSTLLGGNYLDFGSAIAVDAAGNAYVTGPTESSSFPTTAGAFQTALNGVADAFVTKVNPTGTALAYSTFLGGSGLDQSYGIAVDAAGYAYVTGSTESPDFPITPGAFQTAFAGIADTFVTRLNPAGTALDYSTFLAGNGNGQGAGIAVDAAGSAYVAGTTASTNFPTTPGAFQTAYGGGANDVFVAKFAFGTTVTHFAVTAPTSATAGTAFSFTVAALDASNNTVTGYTGTVHFTSSDGQALLPADYTFAAGDSGTHVFSGTTLNTSGSQTITATDMANASLTGTSNAITVSAPATHFAVSAPLSEMAGMAFSFTVTALDASNSTAAGYTGTVHFTSSDSHALLPLDYTFTAADKGTHVFNATLMMPGSQMITAVDTLNATVAGNSNTILVIGPATYFDFTTPASAPLGTAFSFTLTALDAADDTATGYTGTVHFTSTDSKAILPADYTFTSADSGAHVFTATLNTPGNQALTATDTANPAVTGTSIAVTGLLPPPPPPKAIGNILAWGANGAGQLGNGTFSFGATVTPGQVLNLTGAAAISAGSYHSLALLSDGSVWAWGNNESGQLGNGDPTGDDRDTPGPVQNLTGVVAIAAGRLHSMALTSDGKVWAWGDNADGELGTGGGFSSTPVQVMGLTGVVAIAAGGFHSMALTSDGNVWAWGDNTYGGLGDGTTTNRTTPVQVSGLAGVVAIAAGYYHGLALKSDGTVWAWGENLYGQLGNGLTTNSSVPVPVSTSSGLTGVVAIAAGGDGAYHSLAEKTDGTVWAWGHNAYGQLGNGSTADTNMPVQVSSLAGVTAIAGGMNNSLAVESNGTAWAWGRNDFGQLGNGTSSSGATATPGQVLKLTGAAAVAAGDLHSLAIQSQASVPATHLAVSAPTSATAGTAFSFTVTALDASNNTATGYTGMVHFTSSDGLAVLPADYTFTAGDSGTHVFSATTLNTLGSQTITATDTANATITGISNAITVSGAATHFAVTAPTSATAGTAFSFTVTALDASNNTATGYAGTVHFTSTDGLAVSPADYTFTAADNGTHVFSGTLNTSGSQTITATDTASATITGISNAITVSSSAPPPPVQIMDNETITVTDTESFPDVFDAETVHVADAVAVAPLTVIPPINVGAPVAEYSVGSPLGFGGQTGSQQTLAISNIGQVPLTLFSAAISSGSPFAITLFNCFNGSTATGAMAATLPTGGICVLSITYTGSAAATDTGTLVFTDNAALSNLTTSGSSPNFMQSITLNGSGSSTGPPAPPPAVVSVMDNETVRVTDTESFPDVFDAEAVHVTDAVFITPLINVAAPVVDFSAGSLGFGSVPPGQTGMQSVTVSDIGQAPLTLSSALISPVGSPFSISQLVCSNGATSLPTTLPVGGACILMISFTAPSSGPAPGATLAFTDNAALSNVTSAASGPNFVQSIPLTGSGSSAPPPPAPPAVVPVMDNETVHVTDTETFPDVFDGEAVKVTDTPDLMSSPLPAGTLPAAVHGVPYTQQFAVSGGMAPISWSLSGSVPPGLTINSTTGVLSGTPAVLNAAGSAFTVKATDAIGLSTRSTVVLAVVRPAVKLDEALASFTADPPTGSSVVTTYTATVDVTNQGNVTVTRLEAIRATLTTTVGGKHESFETTTPLPVVVTEVAPDGTATIQVTFPGSAGAPGTSALLRIEGTYYASLEPRKKWWDRNHDGTPNAEHERDDGDRDSKHHLEGRWQFSQQVTLPAPPASP